MKRITLLLAVLGLLWSVSAYAQQADVYILAGQSNMMGHGTNENGLPSALRGKQNDLYVAGLVLDSGSSWVNIDAPNSNKYGNQLEFSGFGPEVTFARRISDSTGRPTFILKWALGGQNLDNDFLGNGGKGDNALYPYLVREKTKLEDSLQRQYGLSANYKAFVWMQGESDATPDLSTKYRNNLTTLFDKVRSDFGANIPVIVGRISDFTSSSDWNRVRNAQVNWTESDPNGYLVNTDDLAVYPDDRIHFNAQGLQDLGKRFADAYLNNVGGTDPVEPPNDAISGIKRIKDGWKGRYIHASSKSGWSVVQSAPLNANWSSQKWRFEQVSGTKYRIKNVWTQQYLTAASVNNWDDIYTAPLNTSWNSQKWNVTKVNGQYRLQNLWSKRYLHTNANDWSPIVQAPLETSWSSQKYSLENAN
ncbi:sialate O-acetylesterase [Glaciecola siphonariae]|uniref:Sialate O-acetylesterase n=1 Tax=Glaciecola siphonariae TaxID=521012 RepID=A0ABV9LX71_9ALTE